MSAGEMEFEERVREALAPVEPPATLAGRLEARLASATESAREELDAFELKAMRDPRNWVRPVAAAAVATTAGAGLLVLRLRSRGGARARLRLPGR